MTKKGKSYTAKDLFKVKLLKDEFKYEKISDTDTLEEENPSVPFITLFSFASTMDKFYIFLAIIFSMICGCTTPLSILLFSSYLQSMVTYGKSNAENNPQPDVFLRDVGDFAIYTCIVGIVIVVLSYAATVFMNISAFNQVYRIKQEYLKSAFNQDFQYFDTHQAGDFACKMTDHVSKLEDGIGEKLASFIYYQTAFISSIVMAFSKSLKFAFLCLILFPVPIFLLEIVGRIASRPSKKETIALGKADSLAEEVLSAIHTVYAFSGQQKEIERYGKYLTETRGISIKKGFLYGLAKGTLYFCIFGAYASSFWFGYKLMVDEPEIYDVETMIAVIFGIIIGSSNFGMSLTLMEVFRNAREAGLQIFNLINNTPIINPLLNIGITPETINGSIELKNVVFQYPSRPGVTVLKGVSLDVQRGQTVALVGHSGSGKSTIIQLISRYYDVIDGSVHLDGHDVRKVSVRWLRKQIGFVGQESFLFNTTVRDNIRYGREDASDEEIEKVAKQANAHKFIMKLPLGYDTLVGERGVLLSRGQKQRIAIARALVRNPRILLLDEATSARDTSSEAKVQKALDKAQEGRTTIVVTHRLSTIRNVDKIYVFKSGVVVESGNHDELMIKRGHYYDMIMLQASPDIKQGQKFEQTVPDLRENDESEPVKTRTRIQEIANATNDPEISIFQVVKLFSPEWKSITAASICAFISGFAMPVLAVILGDLIGILSNPYREIVTAQVLRYCLMIFGVGIFSGITNFVMISMYGVARECLTERLRKQLFEKMLQQEVEFYDDENNSTRALCALLSGGTAAVQAATGQKIGTILQAIGTFTFALGVSLYYESRIGLLALLFIPFMAAILYKAHKMVTTESTGTAKIMESCSKIAVEVVANIQTVATLGCEQSLIHDYVTQLLPAMEVVKRSSHWRGIVFGLSRGLFNFMYAATLYYGGIFIVYHRVGYDIILSSAQVLLMGSSSAAKVFLFAPHFLKGIKAAKRVIIMLGRNSKIIDPVRPAVENFEETREASTQNVQFKYPIRPLIQVLQNLNLEIENGKTIALVGASGCGKSTIIQLLERYYDPDDGIVAQNGIPLPILRLVDVRQSIGFVQQVPILFDRTIAENIAYGDNSRKPSLDDIFEAAKQANIHNFIVSLPMGYETNIGSKGTQLSGSQKQRVAIARALIRRPKILILDEATSALDTESEKVVQESLEAAKAGRTCVMIAHRLSTVRHADIICVLNNGSVAERGTHSELMQLKGLYYNLNRRDYI